MWMSGSLSDDAVEGSLLSVNPLNLKRFRQVIQLADRKSLLFFATKSQSIAAWNEIRVLNSFSNEITSPDIITTRPTPRAGPRGQVHVMRFLISPHLQGATRAAASCLDTPTWLAALETAIGLGLWYPMILCEISGCKPNSPVLQSDISVWVVTELPGGDIGWWMSLNCSVCVCLFHLITSLNYSVPLNVLFSPPGFCLSFFFFFNIRNPHRSVSQGAFFPSLPSPPHNIICWLSILLDQQWHFHGDSSATRPTVAEKSDGGAKVGSYHCPYLHTDLMLTFRRRRLRAKLSIYIKSELFSRSFTARP